MSRNTKLITQTLLDRMELSVSTKKGVVKVLYKNDTMPKPVIFEFYIEDILSLIGQLDEGGN